MGSSYYLEPQGHCGGSIRVPGDKSISHRSLMLAALAEGVSEITGYLPSTDCEATLAAFQDMGVQMERLSPTRIRIRGSGLRGLKPPRGALDMGNSGTAMRLMAGVLCGQSFSSKLIGDESLSTRPMRRIQAPLQAMGASIATSDQGTPPLIIQPPGSLRGIHYRLPVASAQVKSCILFAGLNAQGMTCVEEDVRTRDHTERLLQTFSYPLETRDKGVCIQGGNTLFATDVDVPGDISSAAFFMVGALISNSPKLVIRNVGVNPARDGIIEILRLMGARIETINEGMLGAEPVADIVVHGGSLHGISIPQRLVSRAIDEFPILFIAAACARGTTVLSGAEELRVKESDRIHNMAMGLQNMGIDVEEKADGLVIAGGSIRGGEVDSNGDHRIAMAFAMASLASEAPVRIKNTDNVVSSFPGFVTCASRAGLKFIQPAVA